MPTQQQGPSDEEIARRAYEISQSGEGGSDEENWHRAESELRAAPAPKKRATTRATAKKRSDNSASS